MRTAGTPAFSVAFPWSQFIASPYCMSSAFSSCLTPLRRHVSQQGEGQLRQSCPAGRGSAQRRLQPVRKNSHLAPHASLHHPTLLSLTSPALPPWHPSLLFSSATLLFLPFDSDHWVSLRLLCLTPHFARQMDRRREDGLTSRYARVCLWDGRRKRKGGEVPKLFLEVKMSNSNEVRRLLSVKPVWGLAFQATEWQGCS